MKELLEFVPVLTKAYGKWLSFAYLVLLTLLVFRLHVMIAFMVGLR